MPAVLRFPKGTVTRYGMAFPPREDGTPFNALEVEMACFLRNGTKQSTKYDHCIAGMKILWPEIDYHDWFLEEIFEFCKTKFTGVTGAASSAKSYGMGAYCLWDWYCDPINTLSFVISTNKVDARQRIWSYIQSLHNSAAHPMPGRIMHSTDAVALRDMPAGMEGTDQSQVTLVAGGEADAVQRLQGKKNKRVRVYGDEGQDINRALGSAIWNLRANPDFEIRLIGNASQPFDFHGGFCEPVAELGGHSYDYENVHTWPILVMGMYEGTCLHFNDLWSPNFKRLEMGLPVYPYLPRPEEVLKVRRTLGQDDPILWRQHIGCWPKGIGVRQTVFTDPETVKFRMRERVTFVTRKRGFGIDPAYTEFGDDFALYPFDYGTTSEGRAVLQLERPIIIPDAPYTEDDGTVFRGPFARAKRVRDHALEHGVPAKYIGMDTTGRNPFRDILSAEMGAEVIGIEFGALASDELEVSLTDERVSKDAYMDKATEMWYSLRQFAEHDQLRGVDDPDTLRQLTNRKFETKARGKVKLEAKKDFKKRTGGKSPDKADAAACCSEVARVAMGAVAGQQIIEERQAIWRKDARIAARVQPPRLSGQRGVGRVQFVGR